MGAVPLKVKVINMLLWVIMSQDVKKWRVSQRQAPPPTLLSLQSPEARCELGGGGGEIQGQSSHEASCLFSSSLYITAISWLQPSLVGSHWKLQRGSQACASPVGLELGKPGGRQRFLVVGVFDGRLTGD